MTQTFAHPGGLSVVVLIMAAGASRRFGGDKRRARLSNGRTLLEQTLATVTASGLAYRLVLRSRDTLADKSALFIEGAEGGLGCSIAAAVTQLRDSVDVVLILPADLPLLRPDSLRQVALASARDRIVQPSYQSRPGHPVAFGSDFFPALARCAGEEGARGVLRQHREALSRLVLEDAGTCTDVDTPAALSSLATAHFP